MPIEKNSKSQLVELRSIHRQTVGPSVLDHDEKSIKINCEFLTWDEKKGQVILFFPSRPLTEAEHDTVRKLLPNLSEKFYELLSKEALFANVV